MKLSLLIEPSGQTIFHRSRVLKKNPPLIEYRTWPFARGLSHFRPMAFAQATCFIMLGPQHSLWPLTTALRDPSVAAWKSRIHIPPPDIHLRHSSRQQRPDAAMLFLHCCRATTLGTRSSCCRKVPPGINTVSLHSLPFISRKYIFSPIFCIQSCIDKTSRFDLHAVSMTPDEDLLPRSVRLERIQDLQSWQKEWLISFFLRVDTGEVRPDHQYHPPHRLFLQALKPYLINKTSNNQP